MHLLDGCRSSKYLHLVPRKGKDYAAYHLHRGGLCIIDEPIATLLEVLRKPRVEGWLKQVYTHQFQSQFLEVFRARGFLVDQDASEEDRYRHLQDRIDEQAGQGDHIGIVQLVVTNRCNFRCKYCFTNSVYNGERRLVLQSAPENQMMAPEDAVAYVTKAGLLATQRGRDTLALQFFGGEPLVNWPAVEAVLEHFSTPHPQMPRFQYSMVTNGSLITPEIAATLARHGVTVIVSFDSPRGADRPLASGGDSTPFVARSLLRLKEAGITPIFNSVFSKNTWSYFEPDLVEFAASNGIREVGVLLDLDPTFLTEHGIDEVVEKLMHVYLHGRTQGVVVTGYWHTCFLLMLGQDAIPPRHYKTCSGTGVQLSIEPSGDVFACKGSSGHFGHIGNLPSLLSSPTYRGYSGRSVRMGNACDDCEIRNFCSGLCLGPLEKIYGDVYRTEPGTCAFYRRTVERLIELADPREVPHFDSPATVAAAMRSRGIAPSLSTTDTLP